MAGLLSKWMGHGSALPEEVAAVAEELDKLAESRPSLAGASRQMRAILQALYEAPIRDTAPALNLDHAATKLAGGVPLLRGEPFFLDRQSFLSRWQGVCAAVGATELASAPSDQRIHPDEWIADVLTGQLDRVVDRASQGCLDAALVATILRLAAYPALAHIASTVALLIRDANWQHGFCPVCGGRPLLGEFRGLEQNRYLRCAQCATDWPFARFRCPQCGASDHAQLGFFHVEGEESRLRAATCEACHGYVKMVATLSPLSAPGLLVTDLATIHLDLAAAERGYFHG